MRDSDLAFGYVRHCDSWRSPVAEARDYEEALQINRSMIDEVVRASSLMTFIPADRS